MKKAREALGRLGDRWKAIRVREGRFGPNGWQLFPSVKEIQNALHRWDFTVRVDRERAVLSHMGVPVAHIGPDYVEVPGRRVSVQPGDRLILVNTGEWGALIHMRGEKILDVYRAPAVGKRGVQAVVEVKEGKHRIWLSGVGVR